MKSHNPGPSLQEVRVAAALRENLLKRKAQARSRENAAHPESKTVKE